MSRILHCGKLFCVQDEAVLENRAVRIADGRVEAIAPIAATAAWTGEVIDLTDCFVMPGLIDAHVHVCSGGKGGNDNVTKLVGTRTFDAMERAKADLDAGFTTLRDEGGQDFIDVSIRDAIEAGRICGPRMLVSGPALGATGGHSDSHYAPGHQVTTAQIVDGPDAARKAARYVIKYGADQIKLMATGGVLSVGDEPGAQELTEEEMRAALEVAQMHGKLSSAHAHGAAGIKAAIRAGITSIEHGMMMDDACIELMVKHGTVLIPTIIAAHQIIEQGKAVGLNPDFIEKAKRCLENHASNLAKCRKAGVKIGFGTDAGTPCNWHGSQGLEFKLMVDMGFTPQEALLAATRENARLIRKAGQVGAVAAGCHADIIALREDPLADITAMQRVAFVMKAGEVIRRDGKKNV